MADVGFITGRLKTIKAKSTKLWTETVSSNLDIILKGAIVLLSAEVAEKAAGMYSFIQIDRVLHLQFVVERWIKVEVGMAVHHE